MKKVLALALAGMMIASLSAVALAVDGEKAVTFDQMDTGVYYAVEDSGTLAILTEGKDVKQGTTLYIPLNTDNMTTKEIEKYKVKAEWDVGKDIVTKVELVYKKAPEMGLPSRALSNTTSGYKWFVAIESKDATGATGTKDLSGTLSVYKGSSNNLPKTQMRSIEMEAYGFSALKMSEGNWEVAINDANPVRSFSDIGIDSDETITFESVGELQGNFYKQSKTYFGFNNKFNEEIAKAYPDANLDFVNFVGQPSLNKWAVMRLFATENQMVYTLENGKLVKVDATYDADYEAYRFGVKKLGTYVLSDKELDVSKYVPSMPDMDGDTSSTPSEVPTEKPAVKPNPGTGR